jgi:alpha-beta hydrolase superfamily lysophospholipase
MRFSETRADTLTVADGQKFDIHIWEPENPRAVIMAIHGGLAHAGDYVTPALYFKEKGMATVSYDMRGHKQENVYIDRFSRFLEDTEKFLAWTKAAYPDIPIFVMGHSMGGLIITRFGIDDAADDPRIKGYIMSSPYYENAIKVAPIMLPVVKILGRVLPKAVIPGPDITDLLTHDADITRRHRKDEEDGIRGKKATMRFGAELLKTQAWIRENISRWPHPLFAVVAGADQVADADAAERLLKTIDPRLLTYVRHPDNYHENFNELNRQETFDRIHEWMKTLAAL